jgi:hypothetical protein
LSVFQVGNGFSINGIITHLNHEVAKNAQEKLSSHASQRIQESNSVASTSQSTNSANKSISLDLFNVKPSNGKSKLSGNF